MLDRRFGLARGFDTYDDQIPRDPNATERLEAERPASVVVDRALAWLKVWDQGRSDGPRTQDGPKTKHQATKDHSSSGSTSTIPTRPTISPPGVAVHTTSRYDAEIAYTDAQVARVLQWLHAVALEGRTIIVVAGDHGEGLGDHGERTHGMLLYDLDASRAVDRCGAWEEGRTTTGGREPCRHRADDSAGRGMSLRPRRCKDAICWVRRVASGLKAGRHATQRD